MINSQEIELIIMGCCKSQNKALEIAIEKRKNASVAHEDDKDWHLKGFNLVWFDPQM